MLVIWWYTCWLLDDICLLLDDKCWFLDYKSWLWSKHDGYWRIHVGYWVMHVGYWKINVGYKMIHVGISLQMRGAVAFFIFSFQLIFFSLVWPVNGLKVYSFCPIVYLRGLLGVYSGITLGKSESSWGLLWVYSGFLLGLLVICYRGLL